MKSVQNFFAAAAMFLAAAGASATTLTLPPSNAMSVGTYNQFGVYSLDLLRQCAAAGDPRCLPSGPFPVSSSPGQIADQAIVLSSANGMSNVPVPFSSMDAANELFLTPTGNQSSTYTMVDAGGAFVGDQVNRWDVKLSVLQTYLNGHDLVFLFDNNQQGNGPSQFINIWGQARIVDASGNVINNLCFELSTGAGCNMAPDPAPTAPDFVPIVSEFCVDKITGASYNIGTAQNAGDCPVEAGHPSGGYQVDNNISTSVAEFAAFNETLNNAAKLAANGNYFLSINVKYTGNNAGAEQLWLCSECSLTTNRVPEPSSPLLLGVALFALAGVRGLRARGRR